MSALSGIRVVDVTRYIPGPYATLLLADLGADVIKIEEPPLGDPVRAIRPAVGGESAVHAALNRNKRSMLVDLRQQAGARLIVELALVSDVFVESFRPGSLAKRGLGAEALLAQNPRLVYCSLSGYGQTGPMAPVAGHDVNYQARAALLPSLSGQPGPGAAQFADMAGGLYAAIGILAALQARERSGRGQVVDASIWRSALGLLTIPAARAQEQDAPPNELSGSYACYNVYRCRDAKHVSVGALEPKFWDALCRALGHQDRINRQWEREPGRGDTIALFAASFATRDRDDWVRALRPADCCVEPVLDPYEAVAAARDSGALVAQPCGDATFEAIGLPFGLSATPAAAPRAAPRPGQHTDTVLAEMGRSPSAIEALRAFGIVV